MCHTVVLFSHAFPDEAQEPRSVVDDELRRHTRNLQSQPSLQSFIFYISISFQLFVDSVNFVMKRNSSNSNHVYLQMLQNEKLEQCPQLGVQLQTSYSPKQEQQNINAECNALVALFCILRLWVRILTVAENVVDMQMPWYAIRSLQKQRDKGIYLCNQRGFSGYLWHNEKLNKSWRENHPVPAIISVPYQVSTKCFTN